MKFEEELKKRLGNHTILENEQSEFKFTCKACGQCCHNRTDEQTIIVSPYDMYRIVKEAKPDDPNDFIDKHFGFYIGSSSGILIAHLKTKDLFDGRNICTFLKSRDGSLKCSIHSHKPAACRLFPLGRIVGVDDNTKIKYFLQHDVKCNSTIKEEDKDTHTLREWIPDKDETEKAFLMFSDFTHRLIDVISPINVSDSKLLQDQTKMLYYSLMDMSLYRKYDYELPFDEQFESNIACLIEASAVFVDSFRHIDPKIAPRRKK